MPREHTSHRKHPLPKTQEKTTRGHQETVNTKIRLIIFFAAEDGDALYRQRKQDQEPTVAQVMNLILQNSELNLRGGKTTRPFRYDLNKIPYNYTVEVTNKFKALDMIDREPEELWMEVHDIVQEAVINTILKKRNAKRQNGCLRWPYK